MTIARQQRGMTLVEVMVALMVFALIATASVYALRLGVDSRDQLDAADRELREIQLARILMKEDLAQIVDRPVRDPFGVAKPASFAGGQIVFGGRVEDDEKILVEFVRAGWLNPNAQNPRSSLQHVEYVFRDGALVRRARLYLDETDNADVIERVLFDNIDDASAAFLNGESRGELEWIDAWPVSGLASSPPRAIEITTQSKTMGDLRQLFWIGDLSGAGRS